MFQWISHVVLMLCILFAVGKNLNKETLNRGKDLRVIGLPVLPNEKYLFNYQVAVQEHCGQTCGGTIISDRVVMTAAHCFFPTDPKVMTVKVGVTDLNDKGQVVDVFSIKTHQGFNNGRLRNDIAILILQERLNLTSLTIAELPRRGEDFTNELVYISGWGGSGGNLTYTKLKVGHSIGCDHSSHLCAEPTIPKTNAYKGDSGGPLVLRRGKRIILTGIVSGFRHGLNHVFTNVANLRPWIDTALAEAKYIDKIIAHNRNNLPKHKCK